MKRTVVALLSCLSLLTGQALSQQTEQAHVNTFRAPTAGSSLQGPEVHSDRSVTFRIDAPKANEVFLVLPGPASPTATQNQHVMTRDAKGVWSITIGPLETELYSYTFLVDGTQVIDPHNPFTTRGDNLASLVDVPGSPPRFDEMRDVPHGTVHLLTYRSHSFNKGRNLFVYTPPQYDTQSHVRFPVLYLRHGATEHEDAWLTSGRAGVILENLIAERKAVPMIIVMPFGENIGTGGSSPEGIKLLYDELRDDIMPLIEKRFRTLTGRENRAIAGLSMGAGQAFTMGLSHLDTFAWIGEFSSGMVSDKDYRIETQFPSLVGEPAKLNSQLRLFFLSCGTEDPRYAGQLNLVDSLKRHRIDYIWYSTPGGHEWKVWRHALHDFLPRLFQTPTLKQDRHGR